MVQLVKFYSPAQTRVHVAAADWGNLAGTDFWLIPSGGILTTGAAQLITDNGWTATSLALVAGTGGDFLASADVGVTNHILTNATGDILQSPQILGDYYHGQVAAGILGYTPTKLTLEVTAAFSVASADEETSGFGLYEAGGTVSTKAGQIAAIVSDSVNFELASAVDTDVGAAVDNAWHVWKIVVSQGTTDAIEWFIDGTSQGTINLQTDLAPFYFGMHTLTTNRILLGPVHAWYS
jgi:hypothetical protein